MSERAKKKKYRKGERNRFTTSVCVRGGRSKRRGVGARAKLYVTARKLEGSMKLPLLGRLCGNSGRELGEKKTLVKSARHEKKHFVRSSLGA